MSSLLLLGLPSILVFALLAVYLYRNFGLWITLLYFLSALFYGGLRGFVLDSLMDKNFGPLFPYLMNSPVLKMGIVSIQEVVGWSVAALLSWFISDRLLRRFKVEPAPHRVALAAFFCMAAICLSVETAAIGAEWWTWTIKQPDHPIFGKVPLVGMLDWGFVAFDFLLPFLLFASSAPLGSRLISLTLFPLHFFFHPKAAILPEPVPLTPNDLMHAGIFAYVLARAIAEKPTALLPEPSKEKLRWFPLFAVLIVAASTSFADVLLAKNPGSTLASLPLLILGIVAFVLPHPVPTPSKQTPSKKHKEQKSEWLVLIQFGAFVLLFFIVYGLRAPFYWRTQQFVEMVGQGVAQWNVGNLKGAEKNFRDAIQVRPDQPSGHSILAQLLFQQQRQAEARKEVNQALALNPTQRDALLLAGTLDLKEKRWKEALERSSYGNSIYPDRPEFFYLKGVAERNLGKPEEASQDIELAIGAARSGGVPARRALAILAALFGDPATVKALEQ